MKKITTILGLLGFIATATAQESEYYGRVGINTDKPQVTLDIVGRPDDPNATDGLLVPRIHISDLVNRKNYSFQETGTLIWVNGASSSGNKSHLDDFKTELVLEDGFYYWRGSRWEPFGNNNIVISRGNIYNYGGTTTEEQYFVTIQSSGENKGILLLENEPKFSENEKNSYLGMMYYNTTKNALYIFNGEKWIKSTSVADETAINN